MRIRFSKKGLIAASIAGSVLLCGAIFKITTDNGIIKNHEVAHMGKGHSAISDAIVGALNSDKEAPEAVEETSVPDVELNANVDAAALAGVTMSAEDTDAKVTAQTEEKPAEVTPQAPVVEEKNEAVTDTTEVKAEEAPVQEAVSVPVQEAEPVEELVEVTRTEVVKTPVTTTQNVVREVATNVPVEAPAPDDQVTKKPSFSDGLGESLEAGVEDAKAKAKANADSTPDGGVEGVTGEDVFIVFE